MNGSNVFFGGIPSEPDVKKLVERFGRPQPGVIAYEDIERVIDVLHDSARFRTVVNAWRNRLLREDNIETISEKGIGIRVLTENERVEVAARGHAKGSRQIRRTATKCMLIQANKLDSRNLARHDHVRKLLMISAQVVTGNARAITEAFKAPAQLPRPRS